MNIWDYSIVFMLLLEHAPLSTPLYLVSSSSLQWALAHIISMFNIAYDQIMIEVWCIVIVPHRVVWWSCYIYNITCIYSIYHLFHMHYAEAQYIECNPIWNHYVWRIKDYGFSCYIIYILAMTLIRVYIHFIHMCIKIFA